MPKFISLDPKYTGHPPLPLRPKPTPKPTR